MSDQPIPAWMRGGRLERARRLWDEGVSCRDIAAAIGHGCTPDAIIGKARRQHWPAHPKPPNGVAERAALKADVRYGRTAEYQRKRRKEADPWGEKPDRLPVRPERLAVPTPLFRRCQWPRGERPDWRWCDAPTVDGGPWCAEHKAVAWVRRPHAGAAEHGVRW
jgi:hypothetical protein